jgi:hypothetical protein
VEIHGPVKEYDGPAEIVLQEARQLGGEGASIPPFPKNYDVEKQGHFSAGSSGIRKLGTSRETSGSRRKCRLMCRRTRKINDAEVLKADSSHPLGAQARLRTARNDKMIKV